MKIGYYLFQYKYFFSFMHLLKIKHNNKDYNLMQKSYFFFL